MHNFNNNWDGVQRKTFKDLDEASFGEAFFKTGDKVKVPHKGKMVKGKIVRFDNGGTSKAQQHGGGYVVDVGEPASILVPKEKIQKEDIELDENTPYTPDIPNTAKSILKKGMDAVRKKIVKQSGGVRGRYEFPKGQRLATEENDQNEEVELDEAKTIDSKVLDGTITRLKALSKKVMSDTSGRESDYETIGEYKQAVNRDINAIIRDLKTYQK